MELAARHGWLYPICMAEPITPPPLELARASLSDIAQALADKRLPPVEHWSPAHCGDSEMRIAADGTWFHQGTPIGRPAMVRLFSQVLRRESDGSFVLVTPVEKLAIAVDDAPFVATEVRSDGDGVERRLTFTLNTGEIVAAASANPIRIDASDDGPRPYLHVRGAIGNGLEARLARPVYYELAELALADGRKPPAIWSDGARFDLSVR